MAVKFAIGYWFSGGLLVLAVVIAARVDIQIVEFVAERIKLMFRSAGSDLPDEIAERICLRHRVTGENLGVGFENRTDLLDDIARFTDAFVVEISQCLAVRLVGALRRSFDIPLNNGGVVQAKAPEF